MSNLHIDFALLHFMLVDTGQLLKLIVMVTLPITLAALIGIWFYVKRAKRG